MRMLLKMQMPTAAGSKALADGSLPKLIQGFMETAKPEAAYFTVMDGKRTMIAVFDMVSTAQLPALAEPLFAGLEASFELSPAMDAADLRAGLAGL